MALRKFRDVTRHIQYSSGSRVRGNILKEASEDNEITDAATVAIGSNLSANERKAMIEGFSQNIRKMSENGGSIIAVAVLFA